MSSEIIEELKKKGNQALIENKFTEAIEIYTEAITLAPENEILYSNRSAANCKAGKFLDALKDADKAIEIKPKWAKAHARRGTALESMNMNDDAILSYMEAVELDPTNANNKKMLDNLKEKLKYDGIDPDFLANPFANPNIWDKLKADKVTSAYLNDPEFKHKIEQCQKNPKDLEKYMQDPRIIKSLGVLMGINLEGAPINTSKDVGSEKEDPKISKSAKQATSNETEALKEKDLGNDAYKKKDFEKAALHYSKAIELDPTNIVFRNNLAAVHFETKNYDKCIEVCQEAVETGRENRADFKLIAKALARIGSAYQKKDDLKNALTYFNKSLSEHRDPEVIKKSQEVEKIIKEQELKAFINPEISMEEKQKGNDFFTKGDYPNALKHYSEAIKRNPSDAKIYSNRAACYTKLLEFSMAIRDCDECIRLEPSFIKGYLRKGACYLAMKETDKASEAYQKALDLDSKCQEAIDGYRSCLRQQGNDPESVKKRAMQDPEVQKILADPAMQMILQQMNKDPNALKEHLQNPEIAKKIEKLLEVGVIGFR